MLEVNKAVTSLSEQGQMGAFIAGLRKEKNLTQKQLAELLNVSDKAVSKWERGMGYPDIGNLIPLAAVLGISVTELLGGRYDQTPITQADDIVEKTLNYAGRAMEAERVSAAHVILMIYSAAALVAAFVCMLCDFLFTNTFTWSVYPTASLLFTWLIAVPLLYARHGKIAKSLLSLTVFLIPYLFVLEHTMRGNWLISLGIPISVLSLVFLWALYGLFARTKINRWRVGAIAALCVPILNVSINYFVSRVFQPDLWTLFAAFWALAAAGFLAFMGRRKR